MCFLQDFKRLEIVFIQRYLIQSLIQVVNFNFMHVNEGFHKLKLCTKANGL